MWVFFTYNTQSLEPAAKTDTTDMTSDETCFFFFAIGKLLGLYTTQRFFVVLALSRADSAFHPFGVDK